MSFPSSEYKPTTLVIILTSLTSLSMGAFVVPLLDASAGFFVRKSDDLIVNTIGAFIGALLGLVTAYGLYRLQTGATDRAEAAAALERKKESLRYLAGILDDVVKYGQNQIEEVEKFTKEMRSKPTIIHQLGIVASESVSRLSRADNEAAFHAYNTIFAGEPGHEREYKQMLSQTDVLTARLGAVKQSFKNYMDALYKHQLRLKAAVDKSADEAAMMLREIKNNVPLLFEFNQNAPGAIDELNELVLVFNRLSQRGKPLDDYIKEFVDPLKKLLDTHDHLLPTRGLNLRILLRGASTIYGELKSESDNFLQAFDTARLKEPLQKVAALQEKLSANSVEKIKHNNII